MADTATLAQTTKPIPAHVPPEMVMEFRFQDDAEFQRDPYARFDALRARGRAIYTPFARGVGGTGGWVFTHAEDIRTIMQDPETFRSSGVRKTGQVIGDNWVLIPTDLDPPEHGKFRTLMNPIFSPKRMALLEERVRSLAVELIEKMKGRSSCEVIADFARPFPVGIFLEMLGLPADQIDRLVEIEETILHTPHHEQVNGIRALRDYLAVEIEARRKVPTDDLITFAINSQVDGRPANDDEVMGMCFMLFLGGLDTVTSTLSYVFHYLATNPDQQAKLRADLSLIPDAVEELIRTHAVVTTGRIATRDVTVGGVFIKAGDYISMPMGGASRDPAEFERPTEVIFERSPNRHSAFGYGPHRCIGSHLARRETVIALEEWLTRAPPFRLQPGAKISSTGSGVVSLNQVPIVWS